MPANHAGEMPVKPSVLTIALSGGVLALVIAVMAVIVALNAEAKFRSQAQRSTAIIRTLDRIQLAAVTAETSQRGYLIHGNDIYLGPFGTAVADLHANIAEYERLIAGIATPSQTTRIERLKALTAVKLQELNEVLNLYHSDQKEEAYDLFATGRGLRAMDSIRDVASALEEEEQHIFETARANASEARRRTIWTLLVLTLLSLFGFVLAYINHLRSDRLTVVEQQAVELAEAREKADLLSRELNHRVKNLFAIVQSIISATGRQESDPRVAATKARERVHALSMAHSLTSTLDAQQETNLRDLLDMIVRSQMMDEQTMNGEGPHIAVPAQFVTPLGMILHELTTNAIKYGAWSGETGNIEVRWSAEAAGGEEKLHMDWTETCDSPQSEGAPEKEGFGSRMMAMSLIQLGGSQVRQWTPSGLHLRITLPLDGTGTVMGRNK